MEITNAWVDIETSAGRVGQGPLRPRSFTVRKLLSQSGDWSGEFLASDPNISALAEKRMAICRYVDRTGAVRTLGGGVIDQITRAVSSDGSLVITVSGNDLTRELTYRSVRSLKLASGALGVTNGPQQIMRLAPAGWSILGGVTLSSVYAGFDGEAVLNALVRVGEHVAEHWRLGSGREIVWLGPARLFASSGVRAVQHVSDPVQIGASPQVALIRALEEVQDAADVITSIVPRGSGNGGAIATLSAATDPAPGGFTLVKSSNTLTNNLAEAVYGQIERVIDFKDLGPLSNTAADVRNAANMLLQVATNYLLRYGAPQKAYSLELSGLGQLLEPGTRLRVVYRQRRDGVTLYDLDADMAILEVENTIDATGLHTARVVVSTGDRQPQNDDQYLASQAVSAKIFTSHQQLSASVDNLSWRDELDSAHAASCSFWLGDEYTTIQRAVARFRIQSLRSTVKSVGASTITSGSGGASTPTSSAGGASTITSASGGSGSPTSSAGGSASLTSASGGSGSPTSSSGGGTTATSSAGGSSNPTAVTGGSHSHSLDILTGTSGTVVYYSGGWFYTSPAGTKQVNTNDAGNHSHSVAIASHTHDVTVPDHSHTVTVPNHTHSVSVPDHSHTVTIPGHSHSVTLPDHSHTVSILSHTHDVTPVINMEYGLFEESPANTLGLANLVIKLNSGSDLRGQVVDIGGGWYELDLTAALVDDVYRPAQEANRLEISTAVANKTARIELQITIRGVVQAVAYL